MTDPSAERPDPEEQEEALRRLLAQLGITPGADGEIDVERLFSQMQRLMGQFTSQLASYGKTDESGVNWGFTKAVVQRSTAAAGPDPAPSAAQLGQIRDASALADLWLDEEISFDRLSAPVAAWTRAEWVDHTFATWQLLMRPVVSHLSSALGRVFTEQGGPGAAEPMVRIALSGMFASQVGGSLAQLASTTVSAGDVGLPLTDRPQVALLPTNIDSFAEGLGADPADVLLFLSLRESARQRLFGSVNWLGPQLLALVEHYARDIEIDPDALEEAVAGQLGSVTGPADLENAGQALARSLFTPQRTQEQEEVLARLETLLALIEGWVDEVVAQVATARMPAAAPLTESLRRRRATGGPAEAALMALVSLELRPRRTRDAANLWAATRSARGSEARDATWRHPDLLPTAADLADPLGFASGEPTSPAPDEIDAELAKLLDEESGSDGA